MIISYFKGKSSFKGKSPPNLIGRLAPKWPLCMAFFCVIVWGISYAVTRSAVQQIMPFTLACLRFYLAAALLWGIMRKLNLKLQKSDYGSFLAVTFIGTTLYFTCENLGLKLTTASHGSLIIATIPLGTELVLAWRKRCRPPLKIWLGTIMALSGTALLIGRSTGGASVLGDLLMFGAVACWIVYTFQVDNLARRYPPLLITFWMMLMGAISFTPGAILEWLLKPQPWPDFWAWWQVLFLGVVCSALAYDFWNRAVSTLGPTVSNTLLYFIPLFGVLSGILFLNEPITAELFWGGGLIFGGVFLIHFRAFSTNRNNRR